MNIREELRESTERRIAKAFNVDMANASEYHKRKVHNTATLVVHDATVAVIKRMSETGMPVKDIADVFDVHESSVLSLMK